MSSTLLFLNHKEKLIQAKQWTAPITLLLLEKLKGPKVSIGLVSGSDLVKVSEQMGKDCLSEFDFVFPENGLVAYKNGVEIGRESIATFMGEEKLQKFINFCLGYMSELELPIKRGTFIEFRSGLINICPPGRSVSKNTVILWRGYKLDVLILILFT